METRNGDIHLNRPTISFLLHNNILIHSLIAGVDYIAVNQSLTFPAGAAVNNSLGRQCFLIHTTEDSTPEPNESLQLSLTSGSPSFLQVQTGRGTATLIIQDDVGMCNLSVLTM